MEDGNFHFYRLTVCLYTLLTLGQATYSSVLGLCTVLLEVVGQSEVKIKVFSSLFHNMCPTLITFVSCWFLKTYRSFKYLIFPCVTLLIIFLFQPFDLSSLSQVFLVSSYCIKHDFK